MHPLRSDAERERFKNAMTKVVHEALIFQHDHLTVLMPGANEKWRAIYDRKRKLIADALIWFVDIKARPQRYECEDETGDFIPEPLAP